jgi:hypothetical protein
MMTRKLRMTMIYRCICPLGKARNGNEAACYRCAVQENGNPVWGCVFLCKARDGTIQDVEGRELVARKEKELEYFRAYVCASAMTMLRLAMQAFLKT